MCENSFDMAVVLQSINIAELCPVGGILQSPILTALLDHGVKCPLLCNRSTYPRISEIE